MRQNFPKCGGCTAYRPDNDESGTCRANPPTTVLLHTQSQFSPGKAVIQPASAYPPVAKTDDGCRHFKNGGLTQ